MGGLCGLDTRDVIEGKSLSLRNVPIILGALLVGEAHRATFPAPAQATQGRCFLFPGGRPYPGLGLDVRC